jgi:predicted O-methyltransferase YrrM
VFHDIPETVVERMRHLENLDAKDRKDKTPFRRRLRQIPPETGRFLSLIAATAPNGNWIEIGTSAGYSALWLALACQEVGARLTTFEVSEDKAELARETFRVTGTESVVDLVVDDAREHLPDLTDVSFCFLDSDKDTYADCYETLMPNMVQRGILVADNAISHKEVLRPMLARALSDERADAMVAPIGRGLLISRKR